MWQTFVEYITCDSLHLTFFICLVALSVVGLGEIIYQICDTIHKAEIAKDYMHHIDIIAAHVHKRMEREKTEWGAKYEYDDLSAISESTYYVEVNHQQAEEAIATGAVPIYALYYMLYTRIWDDNDVNRYCHQIYVDYDISIAQLEKNFKRNLWYIVIPFTKLYRGFCVLFKLVTYPLKKLMEHHQKSFDRNGKWESYISLMAEIATIISVFYEFAKSAS